VSGNLGTWNWEGGWRENSANWKFDNPQGPGAARWIVEGGTKNITIWQNATKNTPRSGQASRIQAYGIWNMGYSLQRDCSLSPPIYRWETCTRTAGGEDGPWVQGSIVLAVSTVYAVLQPTRLYLLVVLVELFARSYRVTAGRYYYLLLQAIQDLAVVKCKMQTAKCYSRAKCWYWMECYAGELHSSPRRMGSYLPYRLPQTYLCTVWAEPSPRDAMDAGNPQPTAAQLRYYTTVRSKIVPKIERQHAVGPEVDSGVDNLLPGSPAGCRELDVSDLWNPGWSRINESIQFEFRPRPSYATAEACAVNSEH
jgi:hypothetical protein